MLPIRTIIFAALFLLAARVDTRGQGQPVIAPLFAESLIKGGWDQVVGFQYDALNRMYVWEKSGKVWFIDSNGVKSNTPVIDISHEVGNWRDHGLNGFVLDPNFNVNGYIYLYYTVDYYALKNLGKPGYNSSTNNYFKATIARVTRYTCDANTNYKTALLSSRKVLLGDDKKNGIPVLHTSHSGGSLVFGDDGSLLISTGDGSSFNQVDTGNATTSYYADGLTDSIIRPEENNGSFRSQMVNSYNGKILRVDPKTGLGLPSNPFYDVNSPNSARSKVWCLGFRNPFRFTLRKGSGSTDITAGQPGTLLIGEVGWQVWEELNIAKKGGLNFGWPFYEGLTPHTGYYSSELFNYDEPNTVIDSNNCAMSYYKFRHLLIQDTLSTDSIFPHPCDTGQQIPASSHPFTHQRAALDWRDNTTQTRVPIFNAIGTADVVNIDDPASSVVGDQFVGNASVGGVYNTDIRLSAAFYNTYFHADYGEGWIKNVKLDANDNVLRIDTFAANIGPVVYLTINPKNGCLAYVRYPDQIRKICYTGIVNYPPIAKASSNKYFGPSPLSISFSSAGSNDPDGQVLSYKWYFGNGDSSNAANPVFIYNTANTSPQTFTVVLKVTDPNGLSDYDTLRVFINNTPPVVDIISLPDSFLYSVNHETILNLRANVVDAQSSANNLQYNWQTILYHNNHNHPDPVDYDVETTLEVSPLGCDGESYSYQISLKVCDEQGLCGSAAVWGTPDCNPTPLIKGGFIASETNVCRNTDIIFNDTTKNATAWHWYFPGGYPAQSFTQSPRVNYSSSGTYPVYLVVKNDVAQDSIVRNGYIKVKSLPTLTGITNYGSDTICGTGSFYLKVNTPNTNVIFQWYKNNIPLFAAFNDSLLVDTIGTYKVIVTNTNGCSAVASKTIYNGNNVMLSITSQHPFYLCTSKDSALLEAVYSPNYIYQWKKNGLNIPGANNYFYWVQKKGDYSLTVNANGLCTGVLNSNTLSFNNRPDVTFALSGPLTFCNYDSVILSSTPCTDCIYKWYKDDQRIFNAPLNKSSYKATVTGKYKVKVVDPIGCSLISPNWQVNVNPVFAVTASGPLTFCNGDSVVLTVTYNPNFEYKWKRNNTWIVGGETNKLTIKTAGQYFCRVTDTVNDCVNRTLLQDVFVNCRNSYAAAFEGINLLPNPTAEKTFLSFFAGDDNDFVVARIYNMQGELVYTQAMNVAAGANAILLDTASLPAGIYDLQLTNGIETTGGNKLVIID